jgi:hypothetical protein
MEHLCCVDQHITILYLRVVTRNKVTRPKTSASGLQQHAACSKLIEPLGRMLNCIRVPTNRSSPHPTRTIVKTSCTTHIRFELSQ